jgi:hypothetical protein
VIYEDANGRHGFGECGDNLLRGSANDASFTLSVEIQAERIGAGIDSCTCVFDIRDATYLDSKHIFIIRFVAAGVLAIMRRLELGTACFPLLLNVIRAAAPC